MFGVNFGPEILHNIIYAQLHLARKYDVPDNGKYLRCVKKKKEKKLGESDRRKGDR